MTEGEPHSAIREYGSYRRWDARPNSLESLGVQPSQASQEVKRWNGGLDFQVKRGG